MRFFVTVQVVSQRKSEFANIAFERSSVSLLVTANGDMLAIALRIIESMDEYLWSLRMVKVFEQ